MVLESVVADLVNRFLGDFIENLDKSQLSLGIWGGDILLNNLFVKENLLDDLDLPIRVTYGNIGQLRLKIPWKNLYTERTVAELDGLYIIAVPNSTILYNEEKERKAAWDTKQKELLKIEEAKKREAEKHLAKDAAQDTFTEKLVTNVIKNLEVKIANIHVRYEDKFTNPQKPFSVGVTLREISCHTTDANWKVSVIKETTILIHKLLKMDSLSLYWNVGEKGYAGEERNLIQSLLKGNIADTSKKADYLYLIEPMSSVIRLRLNTRPEQDGYVSPKVLLDAVFEEIAIVLSRCQYQILLEFLDSFERMQLTNKFRKYRPDAPRNKESCSTWWRFAYTCVLEDTVRRRRAMWSWHKIREHRRLCRHYKEIYKKKLLTPKISAEQLSDLERCEKTLDVFNITMMRHQAELEIRREGLKKKKEESRGWFGGWFGGSAATSDQQSLGDKVQDIMTPEEKHRLYEAIGYQDNVDTVYPAEFVGVKLCVKLKSLRLKLQDTESAKFGVQEVLNLQLKDVGTDVIHRPAASAIRVNMSIDSVQLSGLHASNEAPKPMLVSPASKDFGTLLDIVFETHPIDGACDARIKVWSMPLQILYHAKTINTLAEFFKPPEYVHIVQLQAAAMAKLEKVKQQTATGLQYALEQQKFTDVNIVLQPTYIIVPEFGEYKENCRMLLLDLGKLVVITEKQRGASLAMDGGGELSPRILSLDEIKQQAYDKFVLQLQSLQLLYVKPGDNWMEARKSNGTSLHILRPMEINIDFYKSVLQDVKIPKMRLFGELPTISVSLSDRRLADVCHLINGIPFPESSGDDLQEASNGDTSVSDLKNVTIREETDEFIAALQSLEEKENEGTRDGSHPLTKASEFYNATDLELKFEIKQMSLCILRHWNETDVPALKVIVESVGAELKLCTFDTSLTVYLGAICIQHTQFKEMGSGPVINLVNTPVIDENYNRLLSIHLLLAQKKHPEFQTLYENTLQKITISFNSLHIQLHREALLSVIELAHMLQAATAKKEQAKEPDRKLSRHSSRLSLASVSTAIKKMEPKRVLRSKSTVESIDVSLNATLSHLSVGICSSDRYLAELEIIGLETRITLQKSRTMIEGALKDVGVFDRSTDALFPEILAFDGGEVFDLKIMVFNEGTGGSNYANSQCFDLSVSLNTGCMQVVFLNKFVQDILRFLNQFQTAKDRISAAGSAVADKAAVAAQDLSQKALRLSLDVRLKAPVIIVPQSSRSQNAVVIDLGKIRVTNSFQILSQKDSAGLPAVLDIMTVELTLMKVFRAVVDGVSVKSECLILAPVTLQVNVARNLSSAWYNGHPDIEISGRLCNFSILLSQGDYKTLMLMLNENLQEGSGDPSNPDEVKEAVIEASEAVSLGSGQYLHPSSAERGLKPDSLKPEQQTAGKTSSRPAVHSTLKANFAIERVELELFTGESDLSGSFGLREGSKSLAKLQFHLVTIVADMRSDQSMTAVVSLLTCHLNDSRPSRQTGITRLISQSKNMNEKSNMANLKYEQDSKQNKNLTMEVNGLYVLVCLEHLMKLSDFFVKGLPETKPPVVSEGAYKQDASPTTEVAPQAPPSPESVGEMKIKFSLNHPEVVLVEDAMKPNSNTLVLDLQLDFMMMSSPTLQTMNGAIKGLSVVSCIHQPDGKDSGRTQILSPINIRLNSRAPVGKTQLIEVTLSDFIITVSASSLRIVTSTLSSLSVQEEVSTEDELSKIPKDLWSVKPTKDFHFWFLKHSESFGKRSEGSGTSKDTPRSEKFKPPPSTEGAFQSQQLVLTSGKIIMKLMGGVDRRTIPFIIAELNLSNVDVRDWSSKLSVSCQMALEVAYFNEKLAAWEPLIEPAELGDQKDRPWQLNVKVLQNPQVVSDGETSDSETTVVAPPLRSINIKSSDILEVTVTKTALDVFQSLGKSFSEAYHLTESSSTVREDLEAPYLLKNESGIYITVRLGDEFKFPPNSDGTLTLDPGQSIQLFDRSKVPEKSIVGLQNIYNDSLTDLKAKIIFMVFEDLGERRTLRIMKAEKRSYSLTPRMGSACQVIAQLDTVYGCKIITLRSAVQVHNTLPFPVEIYYKLSNDAMARCGQVKLNETISLPCDAVYAESNEVYLKPVEINGSGSYLETEDGCCWKDLSKDFTQRLECRSSTGENPPLYIVPKVTVENVYHEDTTELSARTYVINLFPTVIFRNLLPLPVICKIEETAFVVTIEPGEKAPLLSADLDGGSAIAVTLFYQSSDWTGRHWIESKPPTLTVLTFDSIINGERSNLDLSLHSETSSGCLQLSLHSPYWMINKTGHQLKYKAGDDYVVEHQADSDEPVFFLYKKSSSASAKKASLKLEEYNWSEKFSLDTVGSVGSIVCQRNGQSSTVGVKIELSSTGLTKIITFTPYFVVANESKLSIHFKEHLPGTVWNKVRPGESIAFWPVQTAAEKQMVACVVDTELETVPFLITASHTTLLQLYHDFGGINVECRVMEGLVTITFQHYHPGFATVLLVNHTHSHAVEYHQVYRDETTLSLCAGQSAFYTWQDPCIDRELIWSCGKEKDHRDKLIKDGKGDFFVDDGDNKIYWISFLDGMQRILLFTDDVSVGNFLETTGSMATIDQEVVISLQGFGVSLVNNLIPKEVAYFAIRNSGVIWEQKKRRRFRAVKTKYNGVLESGYQEYLTEVAAGSKSPGRKQLDVKLEADYGSDPMAMFKPKEVKIRRSFEYGIWLQYRTSQHQTQLHLKMHRLQLDNQLTGAVFPTVLAPVPPPKSVAADSVPKPFTELSVMIRKSEHSDVKQFKYCQLLIQEMAVKVDQGFLNAIISLFSSGAADEAQQLVAFRQECDLVNRSLTMSTSSTSASNVKHFYDILHFSPLKVHLSFSLYGGDEVEGGQKPEIQWNIMNLFLQSVGIVLTDIQDVVFKLAFFERNYTFFSQSQLNQEIIRHYSQQAIKQMYVLVLGLDVLGNPFGLIRGLSEGIEDLFYEPYQGLIQGPEEFAEGLAIGVKSLFGHAVGGAAGAMSRITGTIGKGIATLTLDEEYQKKRREALNKRPADFKEGLARGGKGLVMGVVHGVTGVVTQPMEGAKKEGVGGFFKGVGKGIVGVFTRPVSGVVDFASSSFEGIRRVADLSDEVQRVRPMRFIHTDGIIRPFRLREAEGHQILLEVEKGRFASDLYLGHIAASGNERHIFLATDKRVIFTTRGDILGHWDSEWEYSWGLLRETPSLSPKGIQVILKEKQKKFFGSGSIGKAVAILEKDRREAEALINRMRIAFQASVTS